MNKRVIAIHLPQFHPFLENDEWWGKGFTEWTNVTKAKPRFLGHYQPHLPSDTGFYDLRLPEAREMQANMAREYGIYGFCYYHYWFNGKRLMDRQRKAFHILAAFVQNNDFCPRRNICLQKLCLLFLRRIVLFLENHIPAGTLDIFVDNHRLRRIFLTFANG